MPECYFFSKHRECSNPECMYLHINPETKGHECPWYARGFCKHGDKCRHRHVKKVPCDAYMAGFCPEGPNCRFGHAKFELPPEEPAVITIPSISATSSSYVSSGAGSIPTLGDSDQPQKKAPVIICHKCGTIGHKANVCPNSTKNYSENRLETVTCHKCGQLGHYANKCFSSSKYHQIPTYSELD
eukprot:TRINITY_DN5012_c1_g3_i2.p1 TRINITY_DN5012_c1_g3~~TRINITY_DN5012_c1_g3_i2.p1  ORF type:complete len:185 (+),score=17.51 TRINITY_DN5012_c1_g3_i2:406-960(+)